MQSIRYWRSLSSALVLLAASATAGAGPLINAGLGGAWYDPATAGQGLVLEIVPGSNLIVAYWFTWSEDGEGREWFVAQGAIDGDRAVLDVFVAEGGRFDAADPVTVSPVGSAVLVVESCHGISWDYALEDGRSGIIDVERVAPDTLCEPLSAGADTVVVTESNAWLEIAGTWRFEGCVALPDGSSHGEERFEFDPGGTVALTIDEYPASASCQGPPQVRTLVFAIDRTGITMARLDGELVTANRFLLTDPDNGAGLRQLFFVDDTGDEPLLTHGVLDSPPDAEGYPSELHTLFFRRPEN